MINRCSRNNIAEAKKIYVQREDARVSSILRSPTNLNLIIDTGK